LSKPIRCKKGPKEGSSLRSRKYASTRNDLQKKRTAALSGEAQKRPLYLEARQRLLEATPGKKGFKGKQWGRSFEEKGGERNLAVGGGVFTAM